MTPTPEQGLTTVQAATELGLTPSTFKRRASQFGIHNQVKRNKAYWPDDALQAMRLACELLEAGRGDETIRRRLHPDQAQPNQQQSQPEPSQTPGNPGVDSDQIRVILRDELAQQSDLAEKYARAAHQIGQHEERERQLVATIDELREQVRLLQAPKPEPEIAKEEKPRPWWQRLWG